MYTVDREVFAVKIIHILNFRVKNILPLNGSTMWRVYVYFIFMHLIFAALATGEKYLTAKISQSQVVPQSLVVVAMQFLRSTVHITHSCQQIAHIAQPLAQIIEFTWESLPFLVHTNVPDFSTLMVPP